MAWLGSAPANPDYGLPTITHTQAQLNAMDFAPFRALLGQQPGMIMVPAYDPHEPASLSPVLIDQVLRGELGYQGAVVTDAINGGTAPVHASLGLYRSCASDRRGQRASHPSGR